MATNSSRPIPDYHRFRLIFTIIIGVVWFVLLFGLGSLIAMQIPGEPVLPFRLAWWFFLVGFFPVCVFAPAATFIGFFQQHLAGAFTLPPDVSAASRPVENSVNPWHLGLQRLALYWIPAALLATAILWLTFPDGIGRVKMAFVLALLGAPLASVMALASSGAPFLREVQCSPQQRAWSDSFFSYLVWRHGIPWGVGNGLINAVLALATFPRTADGGFGVMPAAAVSFDSFLTGVVLSGFMAISAHPHALVDSQIGVVNAPPAARSPARSGRIAWFVGASFLLAVGVLVILKAIGAVGLPLWIFVAWKGLVSVAIAGAAAMATAHWTVAREKLAAAPVNAPVNTPEEQLI